MLNGVMVIDKPEGLTSHDVVARLRRILKTKKIGHTGTLDPFATGVLVMMVGKATRLARFLSDSEKEYEAVMRFGYETDTGDVTGECREGTVTSPEGVTAESVRSVLDAFRGEIDQVPPMYSAKKVEGQRLYKLAREGKEIERKPVKVTITDIAVTGEKGAGEGTRDLGLRVVCSAGTYVRTLAEDIGRRIGVGCHLAELRRTRAGKFAVGSAHRLEELDGVDPGSLELLPMSEAVAHLASISLTEEDEDQIRHGRPVTAKIAPDSSGMLAMLSADGRLLAVGEADPDSGEVRPKIVVV